MEYGLIDAGPRATRKVCRHRLSCPPRQAGSDAVQRPGDPTARPTARARAMCVADGTVRTGIGVPRAATTGSGGAPTKETDSWHASVTEATC